MNLSKVFGWEPRVASLQSRIEDRQLGLESLNEKRKAVLVDQELGNAAAPKQLAKLNKEISDARKVLDDLRQTLQLAEENLAAEQRELSSRKHQAWVKDVETTVELRMQLARKVDKKVGELTGLLAEMVSTAEKMKGLGMDAEAKRLVGLPAFRDRLQAAFGVQLSDFFTMRLNHAHQDAMVPLGELENRERRAYMQRVYGE